MEKMIDKTGPKFHFHQICHHPCFCPVINFPSSCKSTFRLVSNQLSIDSNSNLCFFCFGSTFHMFLCPRIVFFFLWFFSLTISTFDILESAVKSISWHSLLWKNLSDHLSLVHLSAHCAFFRGLFQSAVSHRKSICPFHTFLFDLSSLAYQISAIINQIPNTGDIYRYIFINIVNIKYQIYIYLLFAHFVPQKFVI